jgi:hypothetical protein
MVKDLAQRLSGIRRCGNDFQTWFVFEQPPQSLPQQEHFMRYYTSNYQRFTDLCVGAHSSSLLRSVGI